LKRWAEFEWGTVIALKFRSCRTTPPSFPIVIVIACSSIRAFALTSLFTPIEKLARRAILGNAVLAIEIKLFFTKATLRGLIKICVAKDLRADVDALSPTICV
jgi:hypothetical protein